MKIIYVVIFAAIIGCTNSTDFQNGKRQLENQGYTNIKNTGHKMFCCDEKDTYSSGFSATDNKGRIVEGCICSGILKGVTIRFE